MSFRLISAFLALCFFCVSLALWTSPSWGQQPQQPAPPPAPAPAAPPPAPAAAPPASQTPTPVIRQNVSLVNVVFTVFNRQNKLVSDLDRDNFQVFDDRKPQAIRFFSRQTDLPLRVGLLLDTSNSIRDRLQFEKDAAIDFLFKNIRRDKDQAFLMTVDGSPEVIQSFTTDLQRLRDAVLRQRAGGGTALYDAIYMACEEILRAPSPAGPSSDMRRILVVISDGDDNLSHHSQEEALEMAQRAGIVIYTVSTSGNWLLADPSLASTGDIERKTDKKPGDVVLSRFSVQSGGRDFFPYQVDDLAISFVKIGEELRSQYSLAYALPSGSPDGKFHTIRITVNNKGLLVHARKGYYAAAPSVTVAPPDGPGF